MINSKVTYADVVKTARLLDESIERGDMRGIITNSKNIVIETEKFEERLRSIIEGLKVGRNMTIPGSFIYTLYQGLIESLNSELGIVENNNKVKSQL